MSMELSCFTTPPGQKPSPSTAPTSTSSTAVPEFTTPIFVRATPSIGSSTAGSALSSPTRITHFRQLTKKLSPPRSVYNRLRRYPRSTVWRWLLVIITFLISLQIYSHLQSRQNDPLAFLETHWRSSIHEFGLGPRRAHDPIKWLKENSYPNGLKGRRPRAALISLVRNEELDGILQSMRQLEFHWNSRYNYPWVFFNEKPFSEEFKVRQIHSPRPSVPNHRCS